MLSHRMYALLVISCESQNIYHRVLSVKNSSEIDFNMYHTWHSQFSFSFLRNEGKITSKIKCYRTVLGYYQCCKQRIPFLTIGWISLKRIFKHIIRANFQSTRKKTTRDMKKTKLFLFTWMPWHAAESKQKGLRLSWKNFMGIAIWMCSMFTHSHSCCIRCNTEAPINVYTFNNWNYLVLYFSHRFPLSRFLSAYTHQHSKTLFDFVFISSFPSISIYIISITLFSFYWWYLIFLEYIKFLALFIKWNGTTTTTTTKIWRIHKRFSLSSSLSLSSSFPLNFSCHIFMFNYIPHSRRFFLFHNII